MLEYVAAANAAYAVIRKAVENGRELTSVGKQIAAFTHATDDLAKHAHKKKNSIWSNFTGKDESDLEEFMALEEIKQKENELKQMMIYLGRPGLHSDYVRFCVEARKKRQEAAKGMCHWLVPLYGLHRERTRAARTSTFSRATVQMTDVRRTMPATC